MENFFTPTTIMFIVSMLAVMFNVYLYFRTPQENLERRQSVSEKDVDGKMELIKQEMENQRKSDDRRFTELGMRITDSMALAQNHIHTIDTKVDGLTKVMGEMGNNVTKLATIIDERIPKK